MITDPIKLPNTLASILPVTSGFTETLYRLKDLGAGGSIRTESTEFVIGAKADLSIRQTESNENKAAGFKTLRTAVRIDLRSKTLEVAGAGLAVGSVSVVISLPVGSGIISNNALYIALQQLFVLLLTESDDCTANVAVPVSQLRFDRILSGEP